MDTVSFSSEGVVSSHTEVINHEDVVDTANQPVLRLRLKKPKIDKKVGWREGTVDNEHMGKKKSKCCCIYKKPTVFGESSSEDDEDCENCFGHPEKRRRNRNHDENDHHQNKNNHHEEKDQNIESNDNHHDDNDLHHDDNDHHHDDNDLHHDDSDHHHNDNDNDSEHKNKAKSNE